MKILFVSTKHSRTNVLNFSKRYLIPGILIFICGIIVTTKLISDKFLIHEQQEVVERLLSKNDALKSELITVEAKLNVLSGILDEIQKRDDQLRNDLDMKPIAADVKKLAIGGSDKEYFFNENLDPGETELLSRQREKIEELERQFAFELESYKNIVNVMNWMEDSLQYVPLITPIPEDVYRVTDKYGIRLHPIFKKLKRHYGVDLGCDKGTPIYATADGYVAYSGKNGAFGNFVKLKHRSNDRSIDFGYETRYGHMDKIYVQRGQFVKRGDIIGEVGNTGRSTAPHLHYEVREKGKALDPSEYYFINF